MALTSFSCKRCGRNVLRQHPDPLIIPEHCLACEPQVAAEQTADSVDRFLRLMRHPDQRPQPYPHPEEL
jgi:hypothetical protein